MIVRQKTARLRRRTRRKKLLVLNEELQGKQISQKLNGRERHSLIFQVRCDILCKLEQVQSNGKKREKSRPKTAGHAVEASQ